MSVTDRAIPRSEKEWEAQYDAETLARAEVIKSDQARFDSAKVAAGKIAEREREEARAMQKVAGKKSASSGSTPHRKESKDKKSGGTGSGPGSEISSYNVFKKI
jgi:hypothetical protein